VLRMICTGTTMAKAGSRETFREVDYVLPLEFAKATEPTGAQTLALVTAIGASVDSRFFYARTKEERERERRPSPFRHSPLCDQASWEVGGTYAGSAKVLRCSFPRCWDLYCRRSSELVRRRILRRR
jgi:hypothetical protein